MNRCQLLRAIAAGIAFGITAAASAQPTIPTFTNETATRLSVSDPNFGISDTTEKDFAVADLDNDGDLDVVVARRLRLNAPTGEGAGAAARSTLLMNENGVLTDRTATLAPDLLTVVATRDALAVDVNGDGLLDVLLGDGPSNVPRLLLNQGFSGGGAWLGLALAPTGLIPTSFVVDVWSISAGDLMNDGDAYPDLYFGCRTGNDGILINLGAPGGTWLGFADETTTRLGANANTSAVRSSHITDINLDGDDDILICITNPTGAVRMLANNGSGSFTSTPQTINSGSAYNFGVGDLNQDGRLDFYSVKNGTDQYVLNTGNGANDTLTLAAAVNVPNTNGFGSIARAADLNGDGRIDFLVCDLDQEFPADCARRLKIYFGQNAATLLAEGYPTQQPWTPNGTSDVALIDLDGDGDLDMLIGHCTGNSVFMQDGSPCLEDCSGDGQRDQGDLALLLSCYNGGACCDINGDGVTNQADLAALLAVYNTPCP